MRNSKGFSLVELIVTMAVMGLVISLVGPLYIRTLSGIKEETVSSEVHQDLVHSTEFLRLDMEHAGFGVARDETSRPLIWNETTRVFELRSVLNNSNQTTMGWALLNCTTSLSPISNATYIINHKDTPNLQNMVLLDSTENFAKIVSANDFTCPTSIGIYSAYPFATNVTDSCAIGSCTKITYHLSTTAYPAPPSRAACAQGTFDFLRQVGDPAIGGLSGDSDDIMLSCVADFRVRFDIDTDGNGVKAGESQLSTLPAYTTAGSMMDEVKNIEVLILIQAGQRDDDLNTSPNTTVSGVTLSTAGVTNANNYRWKVLKISGNPMSWR